MAKSHIVYFDLEFTQAAGKSEAEIIQVILIIRLIFFPRVSDEHESFMCAKACDLGLALVWRLKILK